MLIDPVGITRVIYPLLNKRRKESNRKIEDSSKLNVSFNLAQNKDDYYNYNNNDYYEGNKNDKKRKD